MSSWRVRALRSAATLLVAASLGACAEVPEGQPAQGSGGQRAAGAPSPSAKPAPASPSSSPSTAPAVTPAHTKVGFREGDLAADFSLPDPSGKTVRLSDFKGKVVVLDFWATWCPPCRKGVPDFIDLHTKYKGEGVEVIGVSFDSGWEPVRKFMDEQRVNYTVVLGNPQIAMKYGNVSAIPQTFIIDRQGVIRKHHVGYAPQSTFLPVVKSLL